MPPVTVALSRSSSTSLTSLGGVCLQLRFGQALKQAAAALAVGPRLGIETLEQIVWD